MLVPDARRDPGLHSHAGEDMDNEFHPPTQEASELRQIFFFLKKKVHQALTVQVSHITKAPSAPDVSEKPWLS